jgi:hypothetical protein
MASSRQWLMPLTVFEVAIIDHGVVDVINT